MSNEKQPPIVVIIIAVITAIGSLGAALFANWDKIFPNQSTTVPPSSHPMDIVVKEIEFNIEGEKIALSDNVEVPPGKGKIEVTIENLPSKSKGELWLYIRSKGNGLYYSNPV